MFLLKNKFYSILLIAIAFMAIFSTKCFATIDFEYNGEQVSLPDVQPILDSSNLSNNPFIINKSSPDSAHQNYYCLYVYKNDFSNYSNLRLKSKNNFLYPYGVNSEGNEVSISNTAAFYYLENNEWVYQNSYYSCSVSNCTFLYSTLDIYDGSDNLLFQRASQPTVETQGTLAKIVEEQETEKVMEEILGILPIVIVVIVSLIAIRKAIAFLVGLLHRS